MEPYKVSIKVISQQGHCDMGHKVGDEWIFEGKTPGGMCADAYNSLALTLQALHFGATFPWATDPDVNTVACPDPANPVVFELRRLRE